MNILVINCGSSSVKYQLINMVGEKLLAKGLVDRIGLAGALLKHTADGLPTIDLPGDIPNHKVAVKMVLEALVHPKYGVIKSLDEIKAVGHRVVHGGERFSDSVLITDDVVAGIESLCDMAPLHNPANIIGIRSCMDLMPNTPQVAVFDTAFHQTMPEVAFLYGLPYEFYLKYGLRRYGFHGTSHKYVAMEAAKLMNSHVSDLRIITCHLGNGASLCAVKYGKSIDTSMGFTPTDGLLMGTRCGELDPAVIPFLMNKERMTSDEIDECLNRRSGVLGISGVSSDFRDLDVAAARGYERAQLAIDIFALRVKKYIGSYVAEMGGVDAIVFTAGIGENSPLYRDKICNGLEFLGTRVDPKKNNIRGVAREISVDNAKVKIFSIPTNEELVIARDTHRICRHLVEM